MKQTIQQTIKKIVRVVTKSQPSNPLVKTENGLVLRTWSVELYGVDKNEFKQDLNYVNKVTFYLHNTFKNNIQEFILPPYKITEKGWGEFDLMIMIDIKHSNTNRPMCIMHDLNFKNNKYKVDYILTFDEPSEKLECLLQVKQNTHLSYNDNNVKYNPQSIRDKQNTEAKSIDKPQKRVPKTTFIKPKRKRISYEDIQTNSDIITSDSNSNIDTHNNYKKENIKNKKTSHSSFISHKNAEKIAQKINLFKLELFNKTQCELMYKLVDMIKRYISLNNSNSSTNEHQVGVEIVMFDIARLPNAKLERVWDLLLDIQNAGKQCK